MNTITRACPGKHFVYREMHSEDVQKDLDAIAQWAQNNVANETQLGKV